MKNKLEKPILKLPLSEFEVIIEIIAVLTLVFSVIITFKYWGILPNQFPTHFNIKGDIDRWNGRESLLLIPILMIVIYAIMTILERYPHKYNYLKPITEKNVENQYRVGRQCLMVVKMIILLFFSYFQWQSIQSVMVSKDTFNLWFVLVFMVVLFSAIGYYIYKLIKDSEVI